MVLEENMAVKEKGGGGGEEEDEEHEEEEEEQEEAEDEEYESDPEDATLSLAMRRREASDDEEGEERERETRTRIDPRVEIGGSDGESDGQGGVEVYDDEESEIEEEEVEEEEGVEEEEYEEERASEGGREGGEVEVRVVREEIVGDEQRSNAEETELENKDQEEGEKKENEPFAVPTAGAFYMHDDRFRENGGGRHRRTPGGRKLWESKDDRKWGHDKFEELNSQEKQYDKEGRGSKGQFRGRGKVRGLDRRNARGTRPRAYDGRNTPNQPVRTVRGRGPRRYEPLARNNNKEGPTQNKQAGKSHESTSNTNSGRAPTNTRASNVQSDSAPPRKHVFASSLNSASPPFYPSGSSTPDISQTQRRDLPGNGNKNFRPSVTSENKMSTSHSTTSLRGKNTADVVDKLYFDEAPQTFYGKFNNLQLQTSGPLQIATTQSPQVKSKGRGLAIPEQPGYQPATSFSQANRVSQQIQLPAVHQRPVQSTVQSSFRASSQQLGQHLSSVSQASSPPKASPTSSSEPGETESPPGSSKSKTALVGKGKGSIQGNGRGSFLYNGAQVMGASGNMGVSHGDQNFPATPALLQVMQFGAQHSGGLGVPAVGMALPGYVAQPQLGGFGNSEMTWVPVLAGAAGALGASYCSPYLAVDGGYYSRPTGQTSSSSVSSKETSTSKSNNVSKPPQRTELVNDEFGQRQNKPRRYSEMNFGQ